MAWRTVFGEHFNYDLLGFQQKCTAYRDTEGKRNVSFGTLDEIKLYLEGLAQRYQLRGDDPIKIRFQAVVCCI